MKRVIFVMLFTALACAGGSEVIRETQTPEIVVTESAEPAEPTATPPDFPDLPTVLIWPTSSKECNPPGSCITQTPHTFTLIPPTGGPTDTPTPPPTATPEPTLVATSTPPPTSTPLFGDIPTPTPRRRECPWNSDLFPALYNVGSEGFIFVANGGNRVRNAPTFDLASDTGNRLQAGERVLAECEMYPRDERWFVVRWNNMIVWIAVYDGTREFGTVERAEDERVVTPIGR